MTNPVSQEASVYLNEYGREAFFPRAGLRSRAIIPGDDPGDQQPPERDISKWQKIRMQLGE